MLVIDTRGVMRHVDQPKARIAQASPDGTCAIFVCILFGLRSSRRGIALKISDVILTRLTGNHLMKGSTMPQAKTGDTVKVHYTGKLDDGTVFDSSEGREPLGFVLGEKQLLEAFEQAIEGMAPGESTEVSIPADQAYGPRSDEAVIQVPRTEMPEDLDPQIGQRLQVQQQDGQAFQVTVTEASDETVTLDANHPLAGRDLHFEIQLVEIAG